MVASSPNAAPPAPKCALERYGLIREQRNVIIVVVSSASLALRPQTGKSGAASYLGERVPPTNGVSGLNRSAVPFPRARSLARSHCSAAFYFRALRSLSRSPDHRDGLRGGERGGAAARRVGTSRPVVPPSSVRPRARERRCLHYCKSSKLYDTPFNGR